MLSNDLSQTKSPLISVIIPVFNVAPYLVEAIDSVIEQTYAHLEIIIIDDGSTDESGKICDEYKKDKRVKVIHQKNKGLSAARNVGLDMMTGDMVAFLDPDDVYHSDFLKEMEEVMNRENVEIVISKYTVHETTGRIKRTRERQMSLPHSDQGIYDKNKSLRLLADGLINVSVWNKLYRKELWKEIRFPVGRVYEDIFTSYMVFANCKNVYVINSTLYYKRLHKGSIVGNCSWKKIQDRFYARKQLDSFIEENTPAIFTQEQLDKRRKGLIKVMIGFYIRYSVKNLEDARHKDELRKMIIEEGKNGKIHYQTVYNKTAYYIIRFCPLLLKIIYPLYYKFCIVKYKAAPKVFCWH